MLKFERSIEIAAPVEDVFTYVADPSHLPEYFTEVREVKDLRRLPNGGYACTLAPVELSTETSEVIPNERIVSHGKWCGGLDDVTMTTTLDRLTGDQTRVTWQEKHIFHGGIFGRMGEKSTAGYLEHAAEMTLAALKARIEAAIPTGATR
jgi:uncharacterized protein YndB with AHSA1/START domain